MNEMPYDEQALIDEWETLPTNFIFRTADEYEDETMCIFEGLQSGVQCPFAPNLYFREGEVTLWGGINGHGKSLLTGQLALQLADAGERVAIMSFEMLPKFTWARMIRQWLGGKTKDVTEVRRFYAQYRQKLFILDHVGAIDPRAVLGAGVVASTQYKWKHLLIDNLAKVVAGEDDLNAQKNTVQMISDLAHRMNVHVHLIQHVRKGKSESDELGKLDFKGSGAIGDQVDNQVIVQRNRDKEKRRQENLLTRVEDADSPDTFIRVCKQRNGDWEGSLGLWFNRKATAFCVDSNRITPWVDMTTTEIFEKFSAIDDGHRLLRLSLEDHMHAIESAKMGIVDSLRWMAENKADMIVRLQRFEEVVFLAQAEKEALAMMDAAHIRPA